MKRFADLPGLILGLLLCALVIVVALAVRIVYETVMLLPRVWRAERDEPEEQWQHAGPSWPEHLVREDRAVQFHPQQFDPGTV